MMLSIILAKIIGLYFIILSSAFLIRPNQFQNLFRDIVQKPNVVIFSGIMTLIIGLIIIVTHNIWVGWAMMITIIGWVIFIKGVLRLYFPEYSAKVMAKLGKRGKQLPTHYYIFAIATLILGLILSYLGFFYWH